MSDSGTTERVVHYTYATAVPDHAHDWVPTEGWLMAQPDGREVPLTAQRCTLCQSLDLASIAPKRMDSYVISPVVEEDLT